MLPTSLERRTSHLSQFLVIANDQGNERTATIIPRYYNYVSSLHDSSLTHFNMF